MKWAAFGIFLLISAGQDLAGKAVELWVYLVFGVLAVGIEVWNIMMVPAAGGSLIADGFCGAAVGAGLLAAGRICPQEIGIGDGLFFCISGIYLGFWRNLLLLWSGSMCCGLFCLGYYVWGKVSRHSDMRRQTIPFLPFAAVLGFWMIAEIFFRR